MASASKIKNGTLLLLTNLCRLLLAAVFIVSGYVKAVDPKGLLYKLQEYAALFPLDGTWLPDILMPMAILLSAVEFVLGVMLLMGTNKRFSTVAILLMMLLFTPWTLVLAIWEPVQDCGCFGDAFKLSNWATFFKNVLLLMLASFVWVKRSRIKRFISPRGSWLVTLFALLYIGTVEYYGINHLPVMDFRPFAIGSDLNEGVRDIPAEFKLLYRYEKDGNVLELESEGAPDSTWNYLGTRSDIISEGVPARIQDFWFEPMDGGADISEKLLSDSNYTCLLVIDKVESADESRVDKINDIYDYCVDNNMPFYALTSSLDDEVALWRKQTGAEYPFYAADNLLLKTMVRSNPGLLVLKSGRVVAKWCMNDVPELYGDELLNDTIPEEERIASIVKVASDNGNFYRLFQSLFMLLVPLMAIFLLDLLLRQSRKSKKNAKAESDTKTENDKQTIN